ncbi:hypothetical protein K450DRAFT_255069 [Umbelopsis ramanniana AG]|uniref:Uncharacterized protein n=1 Tax=Umbelopsis ramanniana AG TaxID=1314678 RepID=A0AAD5E4Y5_UMBRA|nr:uncharacterized protein K450DRAFT_255069 [Umbelopsis ramanniana AG]KAI8576807.1 hypothetical protein K450DRAFT_255069 [Umbelopsis ramanniana AG]
MFGEGKRGAIALEPYSDTEALLGASTTPDDDAIESPSSSTSIDLDQSEVEVDMRKKMINSLLMFLFKMVIDIAAPLIIYHNLKHYVPVLVAIMVSSTPPLIMVIVTFLYKRKIDIMGCLCIFGFVFSSIVAISTGDVRLVMLRDSTIGCIIGLCFLFSLIPIKTKRFTNLPLQFLFYAQFLDGLPPVSWKDELGHQYTLSRADWQYTYVPYVRAFCFYTTVLWGIVLETEFVIKVTMIQSSLTIDQVVSCGSAKGTSK